MTDGSAPATDDSRRLAVASARSAASKQAEAISVLDVRELITITDYFVICSGGSERQVDTIADEVVKELKRAGVRPVRREGESGARWQLVDFVDFVVHVFHEEAREYYRLDNLWADAPVVDWEREAAAVSER
ncbi:MAG TPA: ribosome silencing factor [Actinomycetota bacterium]|nr:ribosome silencing factor [Actinomycetota bacterium]